jgi:TRAP-type C4-dicarboxylate transport system substrate-binding protein
MGTARMLALVITCVLSLPAISSAQQVKLKAALQVPVTELFFGQNLAQFKKEVEERTRKAVTIEIFDGGKPYNDNQIVGAVTSGAMELGVAGFNQFADKIPAIEILDQPFLFNFDALINAAFGPEGEPRALLDKALLETMGVRVLMWQPVGNQVFFSKGRDVAAPQQIKDKTIRVFSDSMAKFVKLCGGKPALLSSAAMSDALKDGRIDMAMAGFSTVMSRDMWKVSDTITRTAHSPLEFLLFINEKNWQALAPAHQAVLMEVARSLEPKIRQKAAQNDVEAYAFAREKGMKIVELMPHQVAEWRACSSEVLLSYMDTTADLGSRLMAAYGRLRTAPCCSAGPPSGTPSRR